MRLFAHGPRLVEAVVGFVKSRARRLALAFAGVALPLALFAELAEEVHGTEAFVRPHHGGPRAPLRGMDGKGAAVPESGPTNRQGPPCARTPDS